MVRILLLAGLLLVMAGAGFSQNVHRNYEDGRIYVKLKSYVTKTGELVSPGTRFTRDNMPFQAKIASEYGVKHFGRAFQMDAGPKLNQTMVLEFSDISRVDQLIRTLQGEPFVEYAEKIPIDRPFLTPNDPQLNSQWSLAKIGAANAWDFVSANNQIIIAIVDDAVERSHPDLAPNLWVNPGEIPGNGIDDDGNGYIDDINGWDVVNSTPNVDPPSNQYDHGTHVAGIASAATNNNIGIASIGFNTKLMCVRAAGSNPNSIAGGYPGILYAANNGAHVINMSWGSSSFSETNKGVIEFALSKGSILVAAAGNDNSATVFYPAGYNNVVSVASTTSDDSKSTFSNYGEWIRISAPGSSILSTLVGGTYGNKSGTSMASPLVAGLVGLMKSLNPGMPNADLLNCLYSTADDISLQNPVFPGQLGSGRINAGEALKCVSNTLSRVPSANFSANVTTIIEKGSVQFTDRSFYTPTSWQWTFPGGIPASFSGQVPPPVVYNTAGQYSVTLLVGNNNGNNSLTRTNYITVNEPPSCVAVNLPNNWSQLQYSYNGASFVNGFVNGVNADLDKQKAEYFDVSSTSLTGLVSISIRFGRAFSANPAKVVPIRIFDGTSGSPGAQLGVVNLTMQTIRTNVLANSMTVIDLPKNIILPASKKFFVSVDLGNLEWNASVKDSLSVTANLLGQSAASTIWTQDKDGAWLKHGNPGRFEVYAFSSMFIFPTLTSRPAITSFTPKNAEACLGSLLEFDATGSSSSGLLQWQFPGALPPNTVDNQLIVSPQYQAAGTFMVHLLTTGGCNEVRRDSTTILIKATPNINISASKNPICVGETATLTASGGTNFTWSPATGLNTTTGTVVLANPVLTTTYNISAMLGDCSASVPFELEVRAREASVVLSADPPAIGTSSSVTFTAASVNGGAQPQYEFKVNNQSKQKSAVNTYTQTVVPGDQVVCILTSSEPCVVEKDVTSNTLVMGETTVPITLLSFSGQRTGTGNRLSWTTGTEQNSRHFVVERSADGRQFSAIGQVAASGNSVGNLSYNFTDVQPVAGRNFYRLNMVDNDGSFKYSNTILLQSGQQQLLTSLYPNPTPGGNTAILSLTSATNGRMHISIANVQGQVLKTYDHNITNGNVQIQLSASSLSAGNYIIICRNSMGEVVSTQRWTITR